MLKHKLLRRSIKGNIMKECELLFYEEGFIDKLDKNPYLIGCSNCVIDFKEKIKAREICIAQESLMIIFSKVQTLFANPWNIMKNDKKSIDEINEFSNNISRTSLRDYM